MLQVAHTITELDLRFVDADEAYCELLRYSLGELRRETILSVTSPLDRPQNRVVLDRLTEDGVPFWIRKRYVRSDGSLVWVLNHVTRTIGVSGRKRISAACFVLPDTVSDFDLPDQAFSDENFARQSGCMKKLS